MDDRRQALQEDVRFRVLRLLEANPELSQRELAAAVGISIGRAHYVLGGLVEKGLVKLSNFAAAEDKRRYSYILTRKGVTTKLDLTRRYMERRRAEYEALKAEIEALETELPRGARSASEGPGVNSWLVAHLIRKPVPTFRGALRVCVIGPSSRSDVLLREI